jgi:hypothetical protein
MYLRGVSIKLIPEACSLTGEWFEERMWLVPL